MRYSNKRVFFETNKKNRKLLSKNNKISMFFDNNARNIEVKDYSLRILKIAGSIFSILMELSN